RRTPDRGDPWSACPWRVARGPARWSVQESAENAFQYARSWASFPVLRRLHEPPEYHYSAHLSHVWWGPPMRCGQGFALPSQRPEGKTVQGHLVRPVMAARGAGKSRNSAENSALAARLSREITGDVFFDAFNRGRYATDASFYQIMPAGVVVPRSMDEALRALAICRDEGRIVTPRGGGTPQCGQTINQGSVVDFSKDLHQLR